ncbi:hypothetical protein BU52_05560 [Streptomyces toyocaensis]|uniref:Uncharacterized protein n=1 Tax=Streptomyces toyocaensis TaxID=55952 RepID=A0A081XWH2_STRTO|nr:hypothetical protein [Streptomyces toyocaensis]KES07895.1 hypothetical protein BU52_05560 [Streptomyces toyocaensis]
MTTRINTNTQRHGAARRTSAMIVAAVTAGALFATATGAQAADPAARQTAAANGVPVVDDPGFTAAEQEQGATLAQGIARLGVTEEQFAAALEVALTRPAPDADTLRTRLAALTAQPSAEQLVQAAYPGDGEAQAALLPVFSKEEVRTATLAQLSPASAAAAPGGKKPMTAAAGWWDQTKFVVKCSAAVAAVLISFAPAGSSIKVARAVALFKRYGAKKTANIIWRFVNGKHVGSKEREAVKAFIGISAISSACSK